MEKQTERERFRFDKPFVKGDIPPRTKNALWIQIDEEKRKIKDIKEYNSFGQWASILEASPGPTPPTPPVPPTPSYKAGGFLINGYPEGEEGIWKNMVFFSVDGAYSSKSDVEEHSLFPLGGLEPCKMIKLCFPGTNIYNLEEVFMGPVISKLRQANGEKADEIIEKLHGEIVNATTQEELLAVKTKLFSEITLSLPDLDTVYDEVMAYIELNCANILPGILNVLDTYHMSSMANYFSGLEYNIYINKYFMSGGTIEKAVELNPSLLSVLGQYDYTPDGINKALQVNVPTEYIDCICIASITPYPHSSIYDKNKNALLTEADSFGGLQYSSGYDTTLWYNCKENYLIILITNNNGD